MTEAKGVIKSHLVDVRSGDEVRVDIDYISRDAVKEVRNFHKKFDEYSVTPLKELKGLSNYLGVENIFLKDESYRFGLNAFKVLGGSYAIGKYLAEKLEVNINDISFEYLKSQEVKDKLGDITFVTATDGNHGRGIAWAANQLGQKSVVYMPKGSSQIRLDNILKEGAKAEIIDGGYDDAVALSDIMAKEHGWVVIQDTAWEGYEDIPIWIMQGYATILDEAIEQMIEKGYKKPTHMFLQAGVGSFAGSMLGYLISQYGEERPITLIMEPDSIDCVYHSAIKGEIETIEGGVNTIMAGLACGTPNTVSWELIRDYADGYLSCPDYVAARGMRILAAPIKNDDQIVSGESGAVGIGVVSLFMEREEYKDIRERIKLDEESVILIISTEGDTDPQKYKDIIWDGDCSSM